MNLTELLIILAALPRVPQQWGRAGTPAKQRKQRSDMRDLSLLRPCMGVKRRLRLAQQDRVLGWYGRLVI